MLVLSRKIGETIVIGDTVRVTVVDIGQGRVKIGIQAPDAVSVDREEVHSRKAIEKELAAFDESDAALPITVHNRIGPLVDATTTTPTPAGKGPTGTFRRKPR